MRISRRHFLASATLLAGALAPSRALGGVFGRDGLAAMGWDAFYPYVTTDFEFSGLSCGAFSMKLTGMRELSPAGTRQKTDGRRCFALFFDGPAAAGVVQDVYTVEHFALGTFPLFVTEASDGKQTRLTAVINRT